MKFEEEQKSNFILHHIEIQGDAEDKVSPLVHMHANNS